MRVLQKQMRDADRNWVFVDEIKPKVSKFPDEYATCWMCWIQLTKQGLEEWRDGIYSDLGKHSEVCDLCGYKNWKGRRWFPFKWLRWAELGNPSSRFRFDDSFKKKRVSI